MKCLIVFCSTHGTTAKAAHLLRKQIEGDVVVLNLQRTKLYSDLEFFDAVIIGGSIHAGSIQGKVKRFMKENMDILERKNVGLFLCCMREGQEAHAQFDHAFPERLRETAIAKGLFGGEFIFSKMNFFEKMVVKNVSGVNQDQSTLDLESISEFARTFNKNNKLTLV
ncbi:flavodoxin domain-containing protein [Bacillus sp. REN3]|uniref:flavodoxin domain-containing protein n=1 Tax=Bacillus sp. REN3 TaxID=2802440 RepID=UPI001AEF2DC2|nr:flavodoxin domain-containing protein [Bacillus sp. REN3]